MYEEGRSYAFPRSTARANPTAGRRQSITWRFRTPSLRYVALTSPYMHDGGLLFRREVIVFYEGGGCPHSGQDPPIAPLALSYEERHNLEEFLLSLT